MKNINTAIKARRRRPTTHSPEQKDLNKSTENPEVIRRSDASKKTTRTSEKHGGASSDQHLTSSVNRFRVRTKPKTETSGVTGNASIFNLSNDKSNKDGYKVSV